MNAAADVLMPPPRWRLVLSALGLVLVVALASYASLRLTRIGSGVASVWISNGLVAGVLLLGARRRWPAWLAAAALGQYTARIANGDPVLLALGVVAINSSEAWAVAWWVRRREPDLRRAASLGPVARAALSSTLVVCLLTATLAVPLVKLRSPETDVLEIWSTWAMAHVLGLVVVATLVVCSAQPHVRLLGRDGQRLDYAACIALLVAFCWLTFAQSTFPLLFLTFLPLLLLAYRHGLAGMVAGTLVLAVSSGLSAALGVGPFALMQGAGPLARLLFWQFYLACGCLFAYTTTVALAERRRLEARVQRSEARILAITDNLPALVSHFDRDARYTYANARSHQMMGNAPLVGRTLPEVRGEAYARVKPYVDAVLRGEQQTYEIRIPMHGRDVELYVQFVPDVGGDGTVQGFYSLGFDITEQNHNKRELERLARDDALTGLANRRHFDEKLAAAVNRTSRNGSPLMLLSFDLDRFKGINDSFGHAVGDAVLREFATRLRASVFDVDVVARLGGDEFVALVEYSASAPVGVQIARRVIDALKPPFAIDGRTLKIATSIGIGLHHPVQTAQQLMMLADEALYEAKGRGRDCWALREG